MNTPTGKWSVETTQPREFLRRYRLPQIVRIHENCVHGTSPIPAKLDLSQPILLYQAYTCRKIYSHSLDRDSSGGGTKIVEPALVIPDTYPGWIATVTDDGHTAGYFTTIEQVARSEVPYFLLREDIVAYKLVESQRGNGRKSVYEKTTITCGHVLQFLGVYEDFSYKMPPVKREQFRYARCFSQREGVTYVPFLTSGKFYAIAKQGMHSVNHVFLISSIVKSTKLPMTIRIVSGSRPEVPFHFTGILKLEQVVEQFVILGCTFSGKKPVLLEIDVDSDFTFRRSLDDLRYRQTKHFRRMLQYCVDEGDRWRKQIKVAYHVVPQTPKERRWKSSVGSSSSRGRRFFPETIPKTYITTNFDDDDSAMRSNTINSASSKNSSFTSKSSNFFSRFWNLHKPKFSVRGKKRADYSATESVSEFSYCGHLYESVRHEEETKTTTRDVCFHLSRDVGDDGYGTGQMDCNDSTYDSVN